MIQRKEKFQTAYAQFNDGLKILLSAHSINLKDKWHSVARLRTTAAQNVIDCPCYAALSSNQSTWLACDRWGKVEELAPDATAAVGSK